MNTIRIVADGSINAELAELFSALEKDYRKVMPNTVGAFDQSVRYTATRWQEWAAGKTGLADIPPNEKPSGKLSGSIRIRDNAPLNATVYSDHPEMQKIAEGRPESRYDMKKTYPYGKKSRVSAKGVPYLIIPFRWGTPNRKDEKRAHFADYIPQAFYNTNVRNLSKSVTSGGKHPEPNASGEMIDRAEYRWGSRIRSAWHRNAEGMVRMATDRSAYFTFRIISAKSPADSWIRKITARPPVDIISALQKDVEPAVLDIIGAGIRKDCGIQ